MRILFLANLVPYPLDNGGKIFTYSVLKALSDDNIVDVLCFYEKEDINKAKEELAGCCDSITLLPIRVTTRENMKYMMIKAACSMFSFKPLAVNKYITKEMKNNIKNKMMQNKYDCVFFNILSMYGYAQYVKKINPNIKTVLYEQNCEALIYKRHLKETNNYLKQMFLKIEINKLDKFEQKSVCNVDKLILLSDEDREALRINRDKCSIIPIGIHPTEYTKIFKMKKDNIIRMLFVGTMTWAPNNEGIIWFLKNVMPMCVEDNKYELYIIGKNPSNKVQELCSQYKNVYLLGYVENLDEYYDKCDVLIVPLFIGSGQRVKIIEAFSRSYPVISTSIGLEGLKYIDGETVMVADDKYIFKQKIDSCFNYEMLSRIGQAGKYIFDTEYSTEVIKSKINHAINND